MGQLLPGTLPDLLVVLRRKTQHARVAF